MTAPKTPGYVDWARYLTTNLCPLCRQRITRHDDWIECDGRAEHRTCHHADLDQKGQR